MVVSAALAGVAVGALQGRLAQRAFNRKADRRRREREQQFAFENAQLGAINSDPLLNQILGRAQAAAGQTAFNAREVRQAGAQDIGIATERRTRDALQQLSGLGALGGDQGEFVGQQIDRSRQLSLQALNQFVDRQQILNKPQEKSASTQDFLGTVLGKNSAIVSAVS